MTGSEALSLLTEFLNEAKFSYMIVGSFSSNFHGIPRATKDVDLVIAFDAEKWASLTKSLPPELEIDSQGMLEMVTATRKELLRVQGSVFEIELFHLSNDLFDQERFKRREEVQFADGGKVWIATAEDVVIQKLRWMKSAERAKDFDDVVSVMARQGDALDFDYIRSWCTRHESTGWLEKAIEKAAQI